VEKSQHKYWHDRHINTKTIVQGDQVMLYDNKYQKHPRKMKMHLLGPFIVSEIYDFGAIRLAQLDGILCLGWVNDACLNPYISA
jgi:hypothetical protein